MSIYKKYDIRGIYPDELNEEIAYKIGRAYATLRRSEITVRDGAQVVVARDMRLSGDSLTKEVIRGLREGGMSVVDIGLASTPTFYFAVAKYKYEGGLMVSASHNPKQYNGIKMTRDRAIPISGDTGIQEIERIVAEEDFESVSTEGAYEERSGVLEDQLNHDIKYADIRQIKPLTVVADAANAMGALYLEALFGRLSCELIPMNFELDGTFPAHEADPFKPENVADLKKRVLDEKADLGIATDGDGDRIFFIDNKGEFIDPAIIRGILAMLFLRERPGSKIAYDIRPGKITRDMIVENGGTPIVTRVGHSLIKEQAIHEGAYFAGESSGHFFLNMDHGCYEVPMIVTLKLLQEFSESGKTVAEYVAPLKRYAHSGEINSRVSSVEDVLTAIKEKYSDGDINELDGVTVTYDTYWFNVRGSNTEPVIRLNLEAVDEQTMKKKRDEVLAVIHSFLVT